MNLKTAYILGIAVIVVSLVWLFLGAFNVLIVSTQTVFFLVATIVTLLVVASVLITIRAKMRLRESKEQPAIFRMENTERRLRQVRSIRIGNWMMIPIYFMICVVPSYYLMTTHFPSPDRLHESYGRLVFRWTGKRGYMTGLRENGKTIFFTCAARITAHHDCLMNGSALQGEWATIWWFKRSVYFFQTYNNVVRLDVGDRELVGYAQSKRDFQITMASEYWMDAAILVLFIVIVFYCSKYAKWLEQGPSNS